MATLKIEDKILYDMPGLSEKTGMGIVTLRTYVREGKLKAVKVGKAYWVDEKEIAKLFTTGTGEMFKRGKG
jgi:predicted site-specific integrase-resolvase